jgi:hypothetical protein
MNTHKRDDGSYWAMLHGEQPELYFKQWGATSIWKVPKEINGGRCVRDCYTIKLPDGWHYAHLEISGTSCYASADKFDCPTGESAWWAHELMLATRGVSQSEHALAQAIKHRDDMQDFYAKSLL